MRRHNQNCSAFDCALQFIEYQWIIPDSADQDKTIERVQKLLILNSMWFRDWLISPEERLLRFTNGNFEIDTNETQFWENYRQNDEK